MATFAAAPTPDAPRLRLTLVHDNGQVQTNPESNNDPPESQTEASADASQTATTASHASPDAASKPTSSGPYKDNNSGEAQAYLQQEGQKASHIFTGLTPDPHESVASSESSTEDEAAQSLCVAKPASILLDCPCPSSLLDAEDGGDGNGDNSKRCLPFRYGGLELRTNSRSVEVYITEQSTGEEKYVVTSRGVKDWESNVSSNPSNGGSSNTDGRVEWHKFVIVNRGGPATVTSVRIKLVSIRPAECDAVYVHACKVKAKLLSAEEARAAAIGTAADGKGNDAVTTPQRAAPQAAASPLGGMSSMAQMMMAMGGGGQQQQQQQQQPPSMAALMAMMGSAGSGPHGATSDGSTHTGIYDMPATPAVPTNPGPSIPSSSSMPSHADMGMAISALRTMVSSTEESINRRIIDSTQQLDASMAARMKSLESKAAKLSAQVEEQNEIIMRQRSFIVEQGDAMKKMEANQAAMLEQLLIGQNKIMGAFESNRQTKTTVDARIDSVVGGSIPSDKRGEAKSEEIVHGEVRAIEFSAHAIDRYLDRNKNVNEEGKKTENKQADNEDISDGANEETSKPSAMTYRGAENLLSFGEDEASDNVLPSPEEVADEAISDLLTATLDHEENGSAN